MKAKRPCNKCIVYPMCSEMCDDFYIYLDKKYKVELSSFKEAKPKKVEEVAKELSNQSIRIDKSIDK